MTRSIRRKFSCWTVVRIYSPFSIFLVDCGRMNLVVIEIVNCFRLIALINRYTYALVCEVSPTSSLCKHGLKAIGSKLVDHKRRGYFDRRPFLWTLLSPSKSRRPWLPPIRLQICKTSLWNWLGTPPLTRRRGRNRVWKTLCVTTPP